MTPRPPGDEAGDPPALRGRAPGVSATMFLSTGLSTGVVYYAFGVFVKPLGDEFGWSRTEINVALSLGVLVGLANPVAGRLLDRFGARPVMVGSLLLVAAGFLLRPAMTQLWHFYALSCIVYLGIPGATELPMARLVSLWFPRARGRLMGIVSAGNNVGGATMVPLMTFLIVLSGWPLAYGAAALMFLGTAVLAAAFVTEEGAPGLREGRAAGGGQRHGGKGARALTGVSLGEAVRTPAFYFLSLATLATGVAATGLLPQLVPHLENEGLSAGTAAGLVSLMAIFGIISKLVFGWLAEAVTARWALAMSTTVVAAGTGVIVLAGGTALVWPAMALFGLGLGARGALIPLTVPEAFGLRAFGSIYGVIRMFAALSVVAFPVMVGAVYDAYGSYRVAFLIAAAVLAAGVPALALARPPRTAEAGVR